MRAREFRVEFIYEEIFELHLFIICFVFWFRSEKQLLVNIQ